MNAFLSRLPVRIFLALLLTVLVFGVGKSIFREPQQLCMRSTTPGTVVTVRGTSMTSTYVPLAFSVPMGRSTIVVDTPDGQHAEGTLAVYDARSPSMAFREGTVGDQVEVDFCNFFEIGDVYATERDGVIAVYRVGSSTPTGFTLTRAERDGVLAPARVIVSPSGVHVAYITWDAEKGATVFGVAEVSGKNNVVLAELTPEQGEIALDEFSWSGSKSVAYAEVVPLASGPDAQGNAHERTLYRIDVATHVRSGVHVDLVP